jgi:hypothetical protein
VGLTIDIAQSAVEQISNAALSAVCGGASYGELACRSVGAVGGALVGIGAGSIGAGGVATTAVTAAKIGARANAVSMGSAVFGSNKDPGGVPGVALQGADMAASVASFVPGPVGAAGTAWTLGRAGSDLAAAACGY